MNKEEFNTKIEEIINKIGEEPKIENKVEMNSIIKVEEYANRLWQAYVGIEFLEHKFPDKKEIIKKECLNLLEKYYKQNEIIGNLILNLKPNSESHFLYLKDLAAEKFIIASQQAFDFLQESGIKSDCLTDEKDGIKSFCSTKSEYHKVVELIRNAETIYEDLAVYYISKNNYSKAHLYYFLLGELLIKEIYYGNKINDWMMYGDFEIGSLYYNAGLAFMKCYKSLKDKYILTDWGTPSASYIQSATSEIFSLGNIGLRPEQLAIKSFETAKSFLLKSGEKVSYFKVRDYLYELKSELNDFEKNILELFIKITKEFLRKENIVIRKTSENIQEGDVRDYFLSVINVVIKEIAVAENAKGSGLTDLTIFGKDNFGNSLEGIAEFKVWGRNNYKDVISQIKKYLTSFEKFGIIVMINSNKDSILEKYKKEIIKKDLLIVDNSFEELAFGETGFEYFRTKSFTDSTKTKSIPLYHIILDVYSLLNKKNDPKI